MGSDPLICIKCQCGQELDTLLSLGSLSFVIFLRTHLVKGNISQIHHQSSRPRDHEKTINHGDN